MPDPRYGWTTITGLIFYTLNQIFNCSIEWYRCSSVGAEVFDPAESPQHRYSHAPNDAKGQARWAKNWIFIYSDKKKRNSMELFENRVLGDNRPTTSNQLALTCTTIYSVGTSKMVEKLILCANYFVISRAANPAPKFLSHSIYTFTYWFWMTLCQYLCLLKWPESSPMRNEQNSRNSYWAYTRYTQLGCGSDKINAARLGTWSNWIIHLS